MVGQSPTWPDKRRMAQFYCNFEPLQTDSAISCENFQPREPSLLMPPNCPVLSSTLLYICVCVCDYICISLSLVEVSNSKSNSPACLQSVYIEQYHTKAWGETSTQLTAVYSHLVYESNYRCWGHPPSSTRHIEDSGGTSHGCCRCSQPSPQMT